MGRAVVAKQRAFTNALVNNDAMAEPTDSGRRPIGDVLPGMTIVPLPDGHEAETVYMLVKTRSTQGDTDFSWCWRSPEIVNREELLGALISQTDLLRQQILNDWDD